MSNHYEKLAATLKKEIASDSVSAATETFMQGLSSDQTGFCAVLRQRGLLRCSAYKYETHLLKRMVGLALNAPPTPLNLTPATRDYLTSVTALLFLGATCKTVYRDFRRGLNTRSLKSYLAATDYLFWYPPSEFHEASLAIGHDGYAVEELAAALSTHIFELNQRRGLGTVAVNILHESKVVGGFYLDRLGDIAALRRFQEAEVLVDCFGYRAALNGNDISISAPMPLFEKALRLGYIQSANQSFADARNVRVQVKSYSLEDFCRRLYKQAGTDIILLRSEPVERIVMGFPEMPVMRELIDGDTYFIEELVEVALLQKELLLTPEQIVANHIAPGLTILDVLKFERFFRLLLWTFKQYVADHRLEGSPLLYRSMIPVFRGSQFREFLCGVFSTEKATAYLDAFTWDASLNTIFDIQTQPLVRCGDFYLIPMGIIAQSNLVRNHLMLSHFRFDAESETDPVGDELSAAFIGVGAEVRRNVPISFGGATGEVDILALIGQHLFAFECKNSLHPCNPFELRTSYDYIRKGSKQICLFAKAFADTGFRGRLAEQTAMAIEPSTLLHSAIVTGNRMFSGWVESGVKVRPLYELCNIVKNGEMRIRVSSGDGKDEEVMTLRLWQGEKFHPTDLVTYIEQDTVHSLRFSAMKPWRKSTRIRGKTLTHESYLMDPAEKVRQLAGAFPHCMSREPNPSAAEMDAGPIGV